MITANAIHNFITTRTHSPTLSLSLTLPLVGMALIKDDNKLLTYLIMLS